MINLNKLSNPVIFIFSAILTLSALPYSASAEVSLKKRFSVDFTNTGIVTVLPLTNGGLLAIGGKDSTSSDTSARLYILYDKKGHEYDNGTLLDTDISNTSCVTPTGGQQICAYYTQPPAIIGPDVVSVTVIENIPQLSSDGASVKYNQKTVQRFLVDTKIGAKGNRVTTIGNGSFPLQAPLPVSVKTTYIVIDQSTHVVELDDIVLK